MSTEIKVPTLGESVSEATVAKWLKQVGEPVALDEPLVELETDKVTLEVNATAAGTLEEILAEEGANVEVGGLLGRLGDGQGASAKSASKAAPKAVTKPAAESQPAPAAKAAAPAPAATPPAASGPNIEVAVPTLGESVSEATVAKWLKQEGDAVAEDEPLVELETDKVSLEVNAPAAGVLTKIAVAEGVNVDVGALLGIVTPGAAAGARAAKPAATAPAAVAAPAQVSTQTEAAPAAGGLRPEAVARSGPDGTITAADLRGLIEQTTPSAALTLSPAVAKLIAENNLDPARIRGTGPQGRVTKEDVLAVVEGREPLLARPKVSIIAPASAPATPVAAEGAAAKAAEQAPVTREERVRMSKLRQTIARRLKQAQNDAAMLTTFNEVDMTAVMALRGRYREDFEKKHGVRLGVMSFFAKAVVAALREFPAVNARVDGEEIVYNKFFDIGMAVSTPNGLMVPIIRDCDSKSFAEIEKALGDVAKRARDGKLGLEEMQGGSFTVTNGGVFGSLLSTPILNAPQSGILGMHKIQQRPMVMDDGRIEARPMMYLALSYDHRLVDGREAVSFLVRVKDALEDPERLLLDL